MCLFYYLLCFAYSLIYFSFPLISKFINLLTFTFIPFTKHISSGKIFLQCGLFSLHTLSLLVNVYSILFQLLFYIYFLFSFFFLVACHFHFSLFSFVFAGNLSYLRSSVFKMPVVKIKYKNQQPDLFHFYGHS